MDGGPGRQRDAFAGVGGGAGGSQNSKRVCFARGNGMLGDGRKGVTAFGVAGLGGGVVKRLGEADWQPGLGVAAPDRRDGGGGVDSGWV